MIDRTR